jgi:hypothetical protein
MQDRLHHHGPGHREDEDPERQRRVGPDIRALRRSLGEAFSKNCLHNSQPKTTNQSWHEKTSCKFENLDVSWYLF